MAGAAVGLGAFYAKSDGWPTETRVAGARLVGAHLADADIATRARALTPPSQLPPADAGAAQPYGALLDPAFVGGAAPSGFVASAPIAARFAAVSQAAAAPAQPVPTPAQPVPRPVETASLEGPVGNDDDDAAPNLPPLPPTPPLLRDVPLPLRRPASLAAGERAPEATHAPVGHRAVEAIASAFPQAPAPQQPGFFDKLFGRGTSSGALAYANPEDNGLGLALPGRGAYDRYTAVYDISAHTVTLPDGTRLEAHSGLGPAHDNPHSVAQHMRGATPPNLYDLTLRESLFHGVQALRLTPVGGGETYGRGGLLAHTFMLGPRGDSNGCVVFRNYQAFLTAYQSGAIRRLAVVAGNGA